MLAAFRTRFPDAIAECSAVEDSEFFGRSFDAVVAWGLMFLLSPELQELLVAKVAGALKAGGHFLFTSPRQRCEWSDNLTGRRSVSLGEDAYRGLAEAAGLNVVGNTEDDGENYYFFVRKPDSGKHAIQAFLPVELSGESRTFEGTVSCHPDL